MVRTILLLSFIWISMIAVFPVSLAAFLCRLVGLGRFVRAFVQAFARNWAKLMLFAVGARLAVEGRERVPAEGGVCFVGNHQGNLDILVALASIGRPFGFISKKEVLFFPFFGLWVAVLDGVFIDRKSASRAIRAIRKGADRIRAGGAMIIFPEGHRSRGPRMGDFKAGSFKLALSSGAAIVPMTIDGSYRAWEEAERIRPCTVRVVFHDPVPTAGLGPEERKALPGRVEAIIASGLGAEV